MPDSTFQFLPAPHAEAARFIRAKPAVTRQVFDQMLPELKARAFVISGIELLETMQAVRDKLAAVPEGADWERTKEIITDLLENDLGDGAEKRAELLLRTHVFQAYSAMEHRVLVEEQDIFPFWKYKTMGDDRVRDSHAALDGLILPANDPFWQDHFPPWDWGCRCQVIPMTREEVEGIRQAEADWPPERRTVIEGPRLERLRQGHLDRAMPATDPRNVEPSAGSGQRAAPPVGLKQLGEARTWDVQSDFQRGREGALKWNPGDLRLPISEFRARYDADLWAQFETAMRREKIAELPGQPSVWEWLTEDQPAWVKQLDDQTRASVLARIEEGIRNKTTGEVAVAIAPDGVNFPVKQVPGSTMELTREELRQFAGKTGVHNHPASSAFSPEDLRSFVDSGAVEWRVVGPETSYVMRRPPGGWPADVHQQIDQLEKRFFAIAARRERYGHDRQDLNKWAAHHIWRAWAEKVGAPFQYTAVMP